MGHFYLHRLEDYPIEDAAQRRVYPATRAGQRLACKVCGGTPCLHVTTAGESFCKAHRDEAWRIQRRIMARQDGRER